MEVFNRYERSHVKAGKLPGLKFNYWNQKWQFFFRRDANNIHEIKFYYFELRYPDVTHSVRLSRMTHYRIKTSDCAQSPSLSLKLRKLSKN